MSSQYLLEQSLAPFTNGHVMLLEYTAEQIAFASGDVNTTNNTIALAGATFVVGTRVRITGLSEFSSSQIYFSLSAVSPYQFSETPGGTAVNIDTAATGTVTDAEPEESGSSAPGRFLQAVADAVRYEVGSYQGEIDRPAITFGSVSFVNGKATLSFADNEVTVDNTSGGSDLTFGYACLIKNGAATPGNTTGDIFSAVKYASTQTVAVGETRKLQFQITSEGASG